MNEYATFIREDLRLVILRLLAKMPGYTANSSLLRTGLMQVGHSPTRDQVKVEIHWLEEQGLVTVENVLDLLVARITERGVDVAEGLATVPGVKKPGA